MHDALFGRGSVRGRLRLPPLNTNRHRDSFIPRAIKLYKYNCNNIMLTLITAFVHLSNKSAYGRIFYNILLHKFRYNTDFLVKWEQELDIIENIENYNFMMKYITNAFQYTNDTTLIWFQYRISHRI